MTQKTSRQPAIRTIAVFIVATCAIITIFFVDFAHLADRIAASKFESSAEMSALKTSINLTNRANIVLLASRPTLEDGEAFNNYCGSTNPEVSILGCYANGSIFIYDVDSAELPGIRESTLAHEFLHAAWERLSATEQERLHTDLRSAYEDNLDTLESRLALYPETSFYNELHSIIGTEFSDLSGSLESHYARFFTDQDAIVAFYDSYNVKFQELRAQADDLFAQIETNQDLITAKSANYDDAATELNAAIADFNRRAASGYFTSQSAFQAERNTLLGKQSNLEALYAEITALVGATNLIIEQYNANIARTQRLVDSINSNATPTPEL